jgi:glycosyltransferase involved in cell wall biosynthesis
VAHLPFFVDRVDEGWKNPGPRPQERPYFLFVGRLEAIKGLQTLIDIWNKALDFDLLVAGTGNYEKELRARAGSNPCIRFLGALPQQELGDLYHHALACIVPSITYETFGMIIIESFARKTPAIVRDLGALPEVIQDSGGGFVYRTNEELLEAMRRILLPDTTQNLAKGIVLLFRVSQEYTCFTILATPPEIGLVPWDEGWKRFGAQGLAGIP